MARGVVEQFRQQCRDVVVPWRVQLDLGGAIPRQALSESMIRLTEALEVAIATASFGKAMGA